ncbi:MAG: DUF2721 domain-containing protein [Verrucomicrobiota bacterium JB022]|nr:DUF2721 domain-containing protein [Verrucomicrobiota bacterium JB022]
MRLDLTTPALLFPAISLLLLAYTNRFITLANVIRALYQVQRERPDPKNLAQIANLRRRVHIIRYMQGAGVMAFLCCVISMGWLFYGFPILGSIFFTFSLGLLAASLILSVIEINISARALEIHLSDMEGLDRQDWSL